MEGNTKLSRKKAYFVPIIIMIVMGIVLFLPAGTLMFWEAWIYWLGFSIITFFIAAYFLKKSPELLSRRMKYREKDTTKKTPAIFNLFFVGYIIPGIDFRFHWSSVPVWIVIISNIIVLLGYIFIIFVFNQNSYASTIIQVEKEQQVITTGPYSIVRHPMYLGMLLMLLFTPLALGSYWAVLPFLLSVPMNIFRIKNEEEVLLRDLPGYKEYCIKTPYRLIPLIW
ncbi:MULTISPECIES: methyltransferase family protein [Clostridium]|uniref:Isoprenylcysteine carboxyl methyltransferase (ICMT) family protein n=2 Tax=Clostridium TaxID=1485 RepID=D8GK46_CLOLD|nr:MULTISPECIES: isoprenylcysteine carboxylmethyltransferase family protein [Clostridium]ADK13164.1 putative isoprenylcysteine carboxyl methyltransferase [Clostridium ljungdahlii DSM 13528]AGY76388.1 isoprenylcysteine carboxylmethyltransferase family protein [Clostridium autoethanogenum DSM 10061]ALU36551.1 Phospholipid methyltransferase [Clostridium autoethanogenum DSM 10061]OAA84403.1 Isoprenylcysteine carboxyl methyltransferase (ICMT) family protein [Clostridium ljungdahlii DSM 13528]OVY486